MKKIVYAIEFSGKAVADTQDLRTLVRAVGETLFQDEGRGEPAGVMKIAFYNEMAAPTALTTEWCSKVTGSELRYIVEAIIPKNMQRTTLDKMQAMMFLLFGKSDGDSNVRELYIQLVSEAAKKRAEQRLMQTTVMKTLFKEFKARRLLESQPAPGTALPADLLNTLKAKEPEKKVKFATVAKAAKGKKVAKKAAKKSKGKVLFEKVTVTKGKKPKPAAAAQAAQAEAVLTPDVQKLDRTGAPKTKAKAQQAQQPQA